MANTIQKESKIIYLQIGQNYENLGVQKQFDVSEWTAEFPDAHIYLLFKRPGEEAAAPVNTTLDEDGILTWTVSNWETGIIGIGFAEIRAIDSSTGLVKKSHVIPCSIEASVTDEDEAPDYPSWVDRMLQFGENVDSIYATLPQELEEGIVSIQQEAQTQTEAIEQKGITTRASIPADYTTLSDAVNNIEDTENQFDPTAATSGKRLSSEGGEMSASGYFTSAFIPVVKSATYEKNSPTIDLYHRACIYDKSERFILQVDNSNIIPIPSNGAFVKFCGATSEMSSASLKVVSARDDIARNDADSAIDAEKYNSFNIAKNYLPGTVTHSNAGLTWEWTNNSCHVHGKTTGTSLERLYWIDRYHMPAEIKPGMWYKFSYESTGNDVQFRVIDYVAGEMIETFDSFNKNSGFYVHPEAEGLQIAFVVINTGVDVDEIISNIKIISAKENSEIVSNQNAKLISFGNSIMTGTVFLNGARAYRCEYDNAPYSGIARALSIPQHNVIHNIFSDTGLVSGTNTTLLDEIEETNLEPYDYLLTMLHTTDLFSSTNYPLGNIDSASEDGTLAGAVVELVNYVKTSNGNCQLILIGVPPVNTGSYSGQDVFTKPYANGSSIHDVDVVMHQLSEKYHFIFIDWENLDISYFYQDFTDGDNLHANNENTYRVMGDYLGNCIQYSYNTSQKNSPERVYQYSDMIEGGYFKLANVNELYFNEVERTVTDQTFARLLIPVRKGDIVNLTTKAGSINGKPYAFISSDRIVKSVYTTASYFNGTINIAEDGWLAINSKAADASYFSCRIISAQNRVAVESRFGNALTNEQYEAFPFYDEDNVCRVLKTGPSLMGVFHHWGIIGASFDSGEFNYTMTAYQTAEDAAAGTNPVELMLEYEGYEYSCWEYLKKINSIPDFYMYANGGQNARDWIRSTGVPIARTKVYSGNGVEECAGLRGYTSGGVWTPYRVPAGTGWRLVSEGVYERGGDLVAGRTGVGIDETGAGGNWPKMLADYQNGIVKQVYVVNLGSNDINNNYPHDADWNTLETYDETQYYTCGTTADIGTYDLATDTDTVPSGKTEGIVPGVVNSYAAYIGAVLNRLLAIQPDAIIFLATIRNHFANNQNRYNIWEEYNSTLKQIAAMDQYKKNVYILDNGKFGPAYAVAPVSGMILGGHPNAIGYQYIAGYWNTLIDHAIQKNYTRMTQSMFIGTGKKYST